MWADAVHLPDLTFPLPSRHAATKGILVAMVCTFFEAFNVPVFWPILVMYFIMLFCITMKRQIKVGTSTAGRHGRGLGMWEADVGPATSARTGREWQEALYRPRRGTRCPASLHKASQHSCATAQGQGTGPWRPVSHSVRTGCTRTAGCAHVALQRAWADTTEQLVRVPHPGARPACRGPFPDPGNRPPARPAQWTEFCGGAWRLIAGILVTSPDA